MSYTFATIDIETTGLNRYKDRITWVGVGLSKGIDSPISKLLIYDASNEDDLRKFRNVVKHIRKEKARTVFQNGKFDTLFMEHHLGLRIPIDEDVMLMGTAYDLVAEHGLKKMAQAYLGVPDWDIKKKDKLGGEQATIVPYLSCDVRYTWELYQYFYQNMNERSMKIYRELLRPAYRAYRDIERNGLYLDLDSLDAVRKKYNKEEKRLLKELKSHYDINWNSSAQVAHAFFDLEGMPVIYKTKKGAPSTAADVLKELAMKGYELPDLLMKYKDAATRNKMFLNRWKDDCYESRIHPNFNLTNVVSGRTSCNSPNLQQVPRTKDIRGLFSGAPGMILFEADYSQLELRIAAHYAKDKTMLNIYLHDGDIHTETAKLFTNGREPTKEERGKAKAVNFGFLYGMQAKKFVKYALDNYGQVFTLAEAKHIRDLYFAKYARLLPWHKEQEDLCEMQGGVSNMFGRFRRLPLIYSSNKWERASAARRAVNTPVQGSGSDLLISAVTQINKELKGIAWIGATVHDSIIGECRVEDKDYVDETIRRIMKHPKVLNDFGVELRVPLDVDIGWGPWGTH
nr:MAG TPA: DNA POLYMERASE [Caudoviricetes sp.]